MRAQYESEVQVHWRRAAEPSPLWRRLWEKLLADKPKQAVEAPAQDALSGDDDGCKDGDERNLPHE